MLKDKLDKLKDLFIDGEGKPQFLPIAMLIITAIVFVVLLVNLIPSDKVKKAAGSLDMDFNIPQPEQKPKVEIDQQDKETYLKKQELSAVLNRELSGAFSNEAQEITKQIDKSQRRMMIQIRQERKEDLKELKREIESGINAQIDNKDLDSSSVSAKITAEDKDNKQQKEAGQKSNQDFGQNSNQDQKSTKNQDLSERNRRQQRNFEAPGNDYGDYNSNQSYSYREQRGQQNTPLGTQPSSTVVIDNSGNQINNSIVVNNDFETPKPGYKVKRGIKSGTLIPAELQVGLVSSEARSPALVKVTQDIKYQGDTYIPQGSLFLGYAEADYGVRQMFVTLEKLIIGDREIDVKAHLVKENGTPGFASEYIDLTMEKFWPTFLMDFAAGILQSFKDVTYVITDQGLPQKYYRDTLKNKAIDGTTEGITKWTDRLMSDAEKHEAIIIVDPGVKAKVFIDEKVPVSKFKKE